MKKLIFIAISLVVVFFAVSCSDPFDGNINNIVTTTNAPFDAPTEFTARRGNTNEYAMEWRTTNTNTVEYRFYAIGSNGIVRQITTTANLITNGSARGILNMPHSEITSLTSPFQRTPNFRIGIVAVSYDGRFSNMVLSAPIIPWN